MFPHLRNDVVHSDPEEEREAFVGDKRIEAYGKGAGNGQIPKSKKKADDTAEDLKCCFKCRLWCRKYFWEGQTLSGNATGKADKHSQKAVITPPQTEMEHKLSRLMIKHRRLIAVFIPAAFFYAIWCSIAFSNNHWHLFADKYKMTITMVFGSIFAGMTSEGGGAIAFPVMTLALKVAPSVARDFSLMIQSCGMTAALFTIRYMKIQLEPRAVLLCTLGGAAGVVVGLEFLDPVLSPPQKKIIFVSIWFSFAFALFLLNRQGGRQTFRTIPEVSWWKYLVLLITGVVGGIFTSIAGSGLDICCFSVLTLLFRVTEKTATPTSVVLMGVNTCVGFYWRQVIRGAVSTEAWEYLFVCVPIVVLGAPLGSVLGSHFHRLVLAAFVYIADVAALVGALAIVPMTPVLWGTSAGCIVGCFAFFLALTKIGGVLLDRYAALTTYEPNSPESDIEGTELRLEASGNAEEHEGNILLARQAV